MSGTGADRRASDSGTGLPGTVVVAASADATAVACADWLQSLAPRAGGSPGDAAPLFHVALAGGSTPRRLYDLLASERAAAVDWARWEVWFGDERAVPPEDDASNWGLAYRHLLRHVPVPSHRIHRMEAERDLDAAARDYAAALARHCPAGPGGGPRLDVVLLGLGGDGHTASLFPGTAALDVDDTWATPGRADRDPRDRLTLTFPTLNAARAVAFTVTGTEKEAALRGVVAGTVPAARVSPVAGELRWFLDEAAAAALRTG